MPPCQNCGHELNGVRTALPGLRPANGFPPPSPNHPQAGPGKPLPLGKYFKTGWGLFKHTLGICGFCVVYLVIPGSLAPHSVCGPGSVTGREHALIMATSWSALNCCTGNPRIS